jgi:integrase
MPTNEAAQTIDFATLKLAVDKVAGDYRRNTTGKIEFTYVERPSGRVRYKSTGYSDRTAAEAWLRAYKAELLNLAGANEVERPFREVVPLWLNAKGLIGKSPDKNIHQGGHLLRMWGDRRLSTLTPEDLEGYRAFRLKTVKPGTVINEMKAFQNCWRWATKRKLVSAERDRFDFTELMPNNTTFVKRKALKEEQTDHLFELFTGQLDKDGRLMHVAIFGAIAIDTGARKTAIEELTWDRVDLENLVIDFRLPGGEIHNKRRVKSPISPRLAVILKRAFDQRRNEWVLRAEIKSQTTIWNAWKAAVEGTEFADTHPHLMRHSFVTQCLRRGMTIEEVAEVIGDDPAILRKHYKDEIPEFRKRMKWGEKASVGDKSAGIVDLDRARIVANLRRMGVAEDLIAAVLKDMDGKPDAALVAAV